MSIIEAFIRDFDRRWKSAATDKLPLRIIGSVAFTRCVANLHQVERDMLTAAETAIELPDWI